MGILLHFQQLGTHFLRILRYSKLTKQLIHHLSVPMSTAFYTITYTTVWCKFQTDYPAWGKK